MTIGWPITLTRGFGTVGWAMPPCMHWTIAPTCSRKPGMLDHLQGAIVERDAGRREADARRAVLLIDRRRRHQRLGAAHLERLIVCRHLDPVFCVLHRYTFTRCTRLPGHSGVIVKACL